MRSPVSNHIAVHQCSTCGITLVAGCANRTIYCAYGHKELAILLRRSVIVIVLIIIYSDVGTASYGSIVVHNEFINLVITANI